MGMLIGKKWFAIGFVALCAGAFMFSSALAGARAKPQAKGTVMLFLSTDCPVAMKYSPRLNALVSEFEPKGILFQAYFPNELETPTSVSTYATDRGYKFGCTIDVGAERAKKMGVKIVPTAILLDANGKVLYSGAIDDHKDSSLVKKRFLNDALTSLTAGQPVNVKSGEPFGCVVMPGKLIPAEGKATYAEHVKPILDRACVGCHRPGEVAPFSLVGYEQAKKWAPMIQIVSHNGKMPPWKAVYGYNYFQNENRLKASEVETLKRWAEAGAPRGDASKEPKTPVFSNSPWPLGEPDVVLQPDRPYKISADGADDYRHFVIKTDFKETKWIKAMAVRPGNTKVVHHVITYIDEKGASQKLDGKDGQPGYSTFGGPGIVPDGSIGGWAPGNNAYMPPDGVAFELKPGSTLIIQVHYHKTGKEEVDQTKLGLYFAKEKVEKAMALSWMANLRIRIPAGEANHVEKITFPVPADITLYGLMPHMHLLGKEMRADLEMPDGQKLPLIYVKDYDFNWQMNYAFESAISIPKGSKIHITAVFDNSSGNPNNPNDPPKEVRWGEETTDEMLLLIGGYTVDKGFRATNRMLGFGVPENEKTGIDKLMDLVTSRKSPPPR